MFNNNVFKRMGVGTIFIVLVLVATGCTDLFTSNDDNQNPTDRKIANAMSAAPVAIARDAAIMDWPAAEGAPLMELRAGTNGWVCLPDDASTPVNDPMCLDEVWQAMIAAYLEGMPFSTDVAGVGYMLQGGAGASNTDPYKTAPDPGEQWMIDPPHVMWISPDPAALESLSTDPHSGGPYVMWKGTPYAHVMIPVAR